MSEEIYILECTVHEADGLAAKDGQGNFFGIQVLTSSDPYVEIRLASFGDDTATEDKVLLGQSHPVLKSLSPVWDPALTFTVELPTTYFTEFARFEVTILDYNDDSEPDLMGVVPIPIFSTFPPTQNHMGTPKTKWYGVPKSSGGSEEAKGRILATTSLVMSSRAPELDDTELTTDDNAESSLFFDANFDNFGGDAGGDDDDTVDELLIKSLALNGSTAMDGSAGGMDGSNTSTGVGTRRQCRRDMRKTKDEKQRVVGLGGFHRSKTSTIDGRPESNGGASGDSRDGSQFKRSNTTTDGGDRRHPRAARSPKRGARGDRTRSPKRGARGDRTREVRKTTSDGGERGRQDRNNRGRGTSPKRAVRRQDRGGGDDNNGGNNRKPAQGSKLSDSVTGPPPPTTRAREAAHHGVKTRPRGDAPRQKMDKRKIRVSIMQKPSNIRLIPKQEEDSNGKKTKSEDGTTKKITRSRGKSPKRTISSTEEKGKNQPSRKREKSPKRA